MSTSPASGPVAPPMPEQSEPRLIDHQPRPYLHSRAPKTISSNVLGPAGVARPLMSAGDNRRVANVVRATGREKPVLAGLRAENSAVTPSLQAAGEGFRIHVVTDASAGSDPAGGRHHRRVPLDREAAVGPPHSAHRWAVGVAVTVLLYITLLTMTAGAKPLYCCD
ncbi:hypothetical protein ABT075_16765 [Streptomyces sp. NPDC002677]|uniref:hypothetical protein n=1 Tax=Streptomyces sp. NPDC002677 TaxID=3154774 RepID=UPI0033330CB5